MDLYYSEFRELPHTQTRKHTRVRTLIRRHRHTGTQTHRHRGIQTLTHRQKGTHTHRQNPPHTHTHTRAHTHTDRDTHTHTETQKASDRCTLTESIGIRSTVHQLCFGKVVRPRDLLVFVIYLLLAAHVQAGLCHVGNAIVALSSLSRFPNKRQSRAQFDSKASCSPVAPIHVQLDDVLCLFAYSLSSLAL